MTGQAKAEDLDNDHGERNARVTTQETKQAKIDAQRALLEAAEKELEELQSEHETATEDLAAATRELQATSPDHPDYRELKQTRTDKWTAMNEAEGRVTEARRRVESLREDLEALEKEAGA